MKQLISFLIIFAFFSVRAQGITDKEELKKCRNEFSKKICLHDDDGDSILNYLDLCKTEAGPPDNKGCPWPDNDGDGVVDHDDACPIVPGPAENNGCPWPDTDGDGILDKDDQCLTEPGLPKDQGCPKPNCDNNRQIARKANEEYILNQKQIDYEALQQIFLDNIRKIRFDSPVLLFLNHNVEEGEGPSPCPRFEFKELQIENYNTGNYLWNEKSINEFSKILKKPIFPVSNYSFWWGKGGLFRASDDDLNSDFQFLNEMQKNYIRSLPTINLPIYGAVYYKKSMKDNFIIMPSKFNMVKFWQSFEIIDDVFQSTVTQVIETSSLVYKKEYVFSFADKIWRLTNEMKFPVQKTQ